MQVPRCTATKGSFRIGGWLAFIPTHATRSSSPSGYSDRKHGGRVFGDMVDGFATFLLASDRVFCASVGSEESRLCLVPDGRLSIDTSRRQNTNLRTVFYLCGLGLRGGFCLFVRRRHPVRPVAGWVVPVSLRTIRRWPVSTIVTSSQSAEAVHGMRDVAASERCRPRLAELAPYASRMSRRVTR